MDLKDFLDRIESEGGAYGALQWGLRSAEYDLPKHIADQWAEIVVAFSELDNAVEEFFGEAYRIAEEDNE